MRKLVVFVSSPSGTEAEREAVARVLERVNATLDDIVLVAWRWETHSVSRAGVPAQKSIDQQLPRFDIYAGIMSSRFGTPTDDYGSGTEKEFRDALARAKQDHNVWVLFFFNDAAPAPKNTHELDQYAKVLEFKRELQPREGLYHTYRGLDDSDESFCRKLEHQLRLIVKHIAGGTSARSGTLSVFKLHGVPELPDRFLPRLEEIAALKKRVLGESNTVGITSALRVGVEGLPGVGKTVMAIALARIDEDIPTAFPDGVFWVTLGQDAEAHLLVRQAQLAEALGDGPRGFRDTQEGAARLSDLLASKRCLIVLDDLWDAQHATAFGTPGQRCRMLITTRNSDSLKSLGAVEHSLDLLSVEESLKLLAQWSDTTDAELPEEATPIAYECGRLPLALAMAGAMLRDHPERWSSVLQRLRNADLDRIHAQFPNYPHTSLLKALQVSVDALDSAAGERGWEWDLVARYLDFGVFPEDTLIPEAVCMRLWAPLGLKVDDVQDVLDLLVSRSLLQRDDEGRLTLHDLQYDYIQRQADEEKVRQLHQRLLEGYRQVCPNGWASGPDDGYYYAHLGEHLTAADRCDELWSLLLSFEWLQARLQATGSSALIGDFELGIRATGFPAELPVLRDSLRLAAHVLASDPTQLAAQLIGRLLEQVTDLPQISTRSLINGCGHGRIADLLRQAIRYEGAPWLCPLTPCLTPPGTGELFVLHGHTEEVCAVAVTRDGSQAISASIDCTLKLWNLESGTCSRTLGGHARPMCAVAVAFDGTRVISGSDAGTLSLWDLYNGTRLQTLTGHTALVWAVAVMPDGRHAISASDDKTLKVWDLQTGTILRTLEGHSGPVGAVAVMRDGRRAISASDDKTLKVWDIQTGTILRTLEGHKRGVSAVAVTRDGRQAISASVDKTLKVWDLETGTILCTLKGHKRGVSAVAVTPDGRRAISASYDKTLKVWDLQTGAQLLTLAGHKDGVGAVAVTPEARLAISASNDKTLKVWDIDTGTLLRTFEGHSAPVWDVTVTPNARQVISASYDKTLKVWDLQAGVLQNTLVDGHTRAVNAVTVSFDGTSAVSASSDRTLKVWDLATGRLLRTLEGHADSVNGVAVTPDGKDVISVSSDRAVNVWDLQSGMLLRTLEGHGDCVNSAAVTPDGKKLISASDDHTLKVWDVHSGALLRTLEGHANDVLAVAVTPDGTLAVSGSWDQTLKVWDVHTGALLRTLEGHGSAVNGVTVTPDGTQLISASFDQTIKLWDLHTGALLCTFEGHNDWVNSVALTRDGTKLISASDDRTLKVWDLRIASARSGRNRHTAAVTGVTVTPDCTHAISASEDRTLRVWNVKTGALELTLEGHRAPIRSVTVTPDGTQAISASDDRTLKVWSVASGDQIKTMRRHKGNVNAVAVTPDGHRVISGSDDTNLLLWNLATGTSSRRFPRREKFPLWALGLAACAVIVSLYDIYVTTLADDSFGILIGLGVASLVPLLFSAVATLHACLRVPIDEAWSMVGGRRLFAAWKSLPGFWEMSQLQKKRRRYLAIYLLILIIGCLASILSLSAIAVISLVWEWSRVPILGSFVLVLIPVSGLAYGLLQFDVETFRKSFGCAVHAVAITPDGRRVVFAVFNRTLALCDLGTGEIITRAKAHQGPILSVAVTPDGCFAISASWDHTLKLWQLDTLINKGTLELHASAVRCVAITPDGRLAISASDDETLKVWHVETGQLVTTFTGNGPMRSCAVFADGSTIIAGDASGVVHFLRLMAFSPAAATTASIA